MFSKEQVREIRTEFWTTLGRLMRPLKSSTGRNIKWLNYRTGVRGIYFRMDCDKRSASITIDFEHKDEGIRQLFWEQMLEFKNHFESEVPGDWVWEERFILPDNREISRISFTQTGINLFEKTTWPKAFEFLKPNFYALDQWWGLVADIFIDLQD